MLRTARVRENSFQNHFSRSKDWTENVFIDITEFGKLLYQIMKENRLKILMNSIGKIIIIINIIIIVITYCAFYAKHSQHHSATRKNQPGVNRDQ